MILLWALDICNILKVSKTSKDLHVHFCSLSLPNLTKPNQTKLCLTWRWEKQIHDVGQEVVTFLWSYDALEEVHHYQISWTDDVSWPVRDHDEVHYFLYEMWLVLFVLYVSSYYP